jgi:hypothetical protein
MEALLSEDIEAAAEDVDGLNLDLSCSAATF